MAKRIRKPPIQPEVRQNWFQRFERYGESVRQIASKDRVDARTVRKHIELARREIEVREARLMALRGATEQHYRDLCIFAQKLDSELSSERSKLAHLKEDRMWSALRQHMPRSVIWKSFDKWEQLRSEKARLEQKLNEVVGKKIESKSRTEFDKPSQEMGFSRRMVEALSAYIRDAALGQPEILPNFDFHKISEDKESDAVKLVKEILDEVPTWKEFNDLSQLWTELERVRRVLRDELAVITLRRVVPGRCKYCPI